MVRSALVVAACALAVSLPVGAQKTEPAGEAEFALARESFDAGDPGRAIELTEKAIEASHVFVPEREVDFESAKRVLLDAMIQRARSSYRIRRSKYFELLGRAYDAKEHWAQARKAYRKALFLNPSFALLEPIASHPDLTVRQRHALRVEGVRLFSDLSEQGSLEKNLEASGAFYHRWALQASLDERRLEGFIEDNPDYSFELGSFPEVRAATDAGTLTSSERFEQGKVIVFYLPAPGCPRCSEDLDGLGQVIQRWRGREKLLDLAVFVPEEELVAIRRIVRLLAMEIEVGRVEGLPTTLRSSQAELWVVARGGLSWFRRSLGEDRLGGILERELDDLIEFLDETGLPNEEEAPEYRRELVSLPGKDAPWKDWITPLERLEVGPVAPPEAYRALTQKLRSAHSKADASELQDSLGALSRLRFAGAAKSFLLSHMQPRILEVLLAKGRELDGDIRRAGATDAPFFVDLISRGTESWLLLQREFLTVSGETRPMDFLLRNDGGSWSIAWASKTPALAMGVGATDSGAVYHFESETGCRGIRFVDFGAAQQTYEGCPAEIVAGEIVERRLALVDAPEDSAAFTGARARTLPTYTVPVSGPDRSNSLERAIQLFESGDYREASAAITEAMNEIDPLASYDFSDLRYNQARCIEASGDVVKALELYRQIGDVSYQDWIVERQRRIENPDTRP